MIQVQPVKVADLIPYANNARTHSDEQVAQIAASIKEFGWTNPILIDGENGIIAGHGRLAAARKLGMDEVPAIKLDGLSKAQKKALILADNKLVLNSGWDADLLKLEIENLQELDFDIGIIGFSENEIDEMFSETSGQAELGLLPEEKLDNFLNGDTKILRLAYDDQEFEKVINALQEIKNNTGIDDFSSIVLLLVTEKCEKL